MMLFLLGVLAGIVWTLVCAYYFVPDQQVYEACAAQQKPVDAPATVSAEDFSVSGPARSVPWSVRRREQEDAHRTERKRLEEWA